MQSPGGFAIDDEEVDVLRRILAQLQVRSCLEFGAGRSTRVLTEILGMSNVWSFETHPPTLADLPGFQLRHRDMSQPYTPQALAEDRRVFGRTRFDLAFVDGPPAFEPRLMHEGRYARYFSVLCAKCFTDNIVMHDTLRPGEQATLHALLSTWTRTDFPTERGLTLLRRPLSA